jgi:SAM-dependent methyltransferase
MAEKQWFKDWFNSSYYHLLYFNRDEKEAESFIERLIAHLKPAPGAYMLDVACGRGRHSKTLAEHGFFVTGIDLSLESILEAKKSEKENLQFFQHDMRLPFCINYYDYAFNFFTSFGYFRTEREHDNAIRSIADALKHGGIFVIDYLNVHYAEAHLIPVEKKIIEGVEFRIERRHDEEHFYKTIHVIDPANDFEAEHTEVVAKFSLGDFNDMLSFHGLQVEEVFGDYFFAHYDVMRSPRLIIIAKKR